MHGHGLRSFLLLLLSSSAIALSLTFSQSSLPQGQNVTVHWALTGETPGSFPLRLREIEPTAKVIDQQSVPDTPGAGDVTFNTGVLEPGEYVAEFGVFQLGLILSSATLTVVAPLPSVTAGTTSKSSNSKELTGSTTTTTPGSVSNPNSNPGSTLTSVSGLTSIPASSTQPTNSPATSNTTKTALLPTSSSFSQLQSSELQPSSTSGVDSDTTDPPVPASSLNKHFNALPVVVAIVPGLVAVGVIVFIVRCRRRRRSLLNMTPEPLPLVIDRRISESSFGNAGSRTSQGFTRSSSPVSRWQPEEKVPPSLFINTLATTSSASQLNSSSDRHETPPEETSTANATSPVTIAPSPVFTSPASLAPSAAAHVNERLLEEVQWWRSQFASSWAVDDDTGAAGAPPRYPGSVARVRYTEASGIV